MLNDKQFRQPERQAIVAALFKICDPCGMENLKTGDTVQLKSGGPIMTLGAEMAVGGYKCHWFSGTDLKEGMFYLEELQRAQAREREDSPGSHSLRTY